MPFYSILHPERVNEDLLPILRNPTLRRVSTHFGSMKKEERFRGLLHAHGKEEFTTSPLQYR
jgi:hypothetical protein